MAIQRLHSSKGPLGCAEVALLAAVVLFIVVAGLAHGQYAAYSSAPACGASSGSNCIATLSGTVTDVRTIPGTRSCSYHQNTGQTCTTSPPSYDMTFSGGLGSYTANFGNDDVLGINSGAAVTGTVYQGQVMTVKVAEVTYDTNDLPAAATSTILYVIAGIFGVLALGVAVRLVMVTLRS